VPVGGEPLSAGGAADQHRRGRRCDPLLGQQVRSQSPDRFGEVALKRTLGAGELAYATQLVTRDPHTRGLLAQPR
jgi:hypothetical protein